MNYKAFYRTYRPSNFSEVIGQEHVVRSLINLINMDKISHGYLFCGPRGTGKTSIAKIFANAINCIHSSKKEEACELCIKNSNKSLDIIEIDAASNNSVNDIRLIKEQIEFGPTNSPYKIYIIDEVHMLSKGAFNALLMILEQPPKHIIFIFATTEPDKIPDTVLSRLQRYNFKRISLSSLEKQLISILSKENIKYDQESIEMIASLANGSLRDALSIADQINAYSNSNITIDDVIEVFGLSTIESQIHFLNLLANKSLATALDYFDVLVNNGIDVLKFIVSLIDLLKDYLIYKNTKNLNLINIKNPKILETIILNPKHIHKILDILISLLNESKYSDISIQLFQLSIIKICSLDENLIDFDKRGIINKNNKLEKTEEKFLEKTATNTFDFNNYKNEYRDITDEYFASEKLEQLENTKPLEADFDENHKIPNVELPNIQHKTKTILSDFSKTKIQDDFDNLINEGMNKSIDDLKKEKIINDATELLNISNEEDGSGQEIDESLLNNYDTSKQIFDTNDISLNENIINKSIEQKNDKEKDNVKIDSTNTSTETKEFNFIDNNTKTTPTTNFEHVENNLTQHKIVNLFLLSKKDTFNIFKNKLDKASCDEDPEYDSYVILLKEAKFICSSNDFILLSSKEDWVVDDLNSKYNDPKFRTFIIKHFGNNVHFFAIKKNDYLTSKDLLKELKDNNRMPTPVPLEQIEHSNVSDFSNEDNAINDLESKSKLLFGNLFSRKKE